MVGFGCLSYPAPGEAWIEGLVVDKRLRGQGLGTQLGKHLIAQATLAGARIVRLSTAATNAPMLHIYMNKLDFHPAGRWLRVFNLPATAFTDWPVPVPGRVTPAEAWQFVAATPSYQSSHHLWTTPEDFTVQAQFTEPLLRRQIERRQYIAVRRSGRLLALAMLGPSSQHNAPPGSLRLLQIYALQDSDFAATLARAGRSARVRGQSLAFMIPVPSDTMRRQLIRRAVANSANWTELVLLEKWLAE